MDAETHEGAVDKESVAADAVVDAGGVREGATVRAAVDRGGGDFEVLRHLRLLRDLLRDLRLRRLEDSCRRSRRGDLCLPYERMQSILMIKKASSRN